MSLVDIAPSVANSFVRAIAIITGKRIIAAMGACTKISPMKSGKRNVRRMTRVITLSGFERLINVQLLRYDAKDWFFRKGKVLT